MPKTRARKPRLPAIALPTLSPHWHPDGCDCEPSRPYLRVSKRGGRVDMIAPELQLMAIEGWARANNKRLLEPYCDIDRSGRTFRKRSVDKIIAEITAGQYRHVSLWKWSRWARNQQESAKYLKFVRDVGGWVDSATEDADQTTALGELMLGMIGLFDAYTSNVMRETWLNVHARRRDAGLPHGGRERFGYDYIESRDDAGQKQTNYEIIEDEAEMLRTAYGLYNEGASFNELLKYFQSTGTTTTLGSQWTAQGIGRMMDTGFAAGLIRERTAPTDIPANSISSYDTWRAGAHKAIITRATWDAYKAKRNANAGIAPRLRRPVHVLSGLLFCTVCRRRLVTKYAGAGRTHQWQCPYQRAFHPSVAVSVNNRLALDAVRDWVRDAVGEKIDVATARAKAEAKLAAAERTKRSEQQQIRDEIEMLSGEIDNLIDSLGKAKGIVKDRIDTRLEQVSTDIELLHAKLMPQADAPERYFNETDQAALHELDAVWDEVSETPGILNEFLGKLASRVEVSPRSASSTRKSASDRVAPVGVWESPDLSTWLEGRLA